MLAVALLSFSCGSGEAPPSEEAAPAPEPAAQESSGEKQYFEAKGLIEDIDRNDNTITIDHEDIPGFMNAMSMSFSVEDPALLDGLGIESEVEFRVEVLGDGTYYIDRINMVDE
jgi:Cu/Ag efflux protein CusF